MYMKKVNLIKERSASYEITPNEKKSENLTSATKTSS